MEPCTGLLTIDLDALARNYHYLKKEASPSRCGAVVKANAYGLGLEPVIQRLVSEGCTLFFVATLGEAVQLRRLLGDATIYVFEGVASGAEAILARDNLVPVLNSLEQIQCWGAYAGSSPSSFPQGASAAIQIDTGMSRLGLSAAEVEAVGSRPELLEGLRLECVMTHLACADEPGHGLNQEQLERFEKLRAMLPAAPTSIGHSAGILLGPSFQGELVRPGIALYGGNPFSDRPNSLEEVVRLQGKVIQVREVERPASVGYGATHRVQPPTRLATVGLGYADGYPRSLSNRGFSCWGGIRLPVVGRISMDLITLDVTEAPPQEVRPGILLDLIGGGVPLEEVAQRAGTVSYEILTGLGSRFRRLYKGAGDMTG